MSSKSTLLPWIGAIISEFISGVFHGSVTGAGVSVFAADGQTLVTKKIIIMTIVGACIGGIKDVALYIQSNPMPNVFAQPVVAPVAGPVATPTVSDQPTTLVQPTSAPAVTPTK